MKNDFYGFRKTDLSRRHDKTILSVYEKSLFHGATQKTIFLFQKKRFLMERRKNYFFIFQKMHFSRVLEKVIFTISNKSLFQGATKKRFFRLPKNRFLRAP